MQYRFFYAKAYRFPRRFSHISRRGGNLPPAKNAKYFSLTFPRLRGIQSRRSCVLTALVAICRPPEREAFSLTFPHNVRIIITYYLLPITSYFLLLTSTPAARKNGNAVFLCLSAFTRNTIAATPRANG